MRRRALSGCRRLDALEPGITQVEWGPNGEVLMPGHLPTRPGEL